MTASREFLGSPYKLQLNIELHWLLLKATFLKFTQILHHEWYPPHCTDRVRGPGQWQDSPIWSPRAKSEARRNPAFPVTIQGSSHFTTSEQGQLLQTCPFGSFTPTSLSLRMNVMCMVKELYRNALEVIAPKLYLLYF